MSDRDSSAVGLLNKERQIRGYLYPPDESGNDGDAPAKQPQVLQHAGKEPRKRKSKQSRRHSSRDGDGDAYDAEASEEDDSVSRSSAVHSTVRFSPW